MRHTKTTLPFKVTAEQMQQLVEMIGSYPKERSSVMPVMQNAQKIYGYLPVEVQTVIAEKLELPIGMVYGISTFYSQFSLSPKGKHVISVCMGTACYVKNAGKILERIVTILGIKHGECTQDGLFSIDECRCIGACGLAPVMTVGKDVYGRITPDDVDGILEKYRNAEEEVL